MAAALKDVNNQRMTVLVFTANSLYKEVGGIRRRGGAETGKKVGEEKQSKFMFVGRHSS